jgi:7-carboxy-7-deazaguanine synthase
MNVDSILEIINKYSCNKICLTGGEPLLQNDTPNLINFLIDKKYKICLETNGSLKIEGLSNKNSLMISLDIKCPSSNMDDKNLFSNIKFLKEKDQLKFVIFDIKDYNYAKKIVEKYKPTCCVYFQPVWGTNLINLADWIINDKLDVKFGLQLHKIIWGESCQI